jgi:hypothetical protein
LEPANSFNRPALNLEQRLDDSSKLLRLEEHVALAEKGGD